MLIVGLTGGIATGKSHALAEFKRLGACVIDADLLAHRVIERGRRAYDEVVREFGETVLGAGGEIDRKKLGKIVFADESRLKRLNAIVHPRVFEEQEAELFALESRKRRKCRVVIVDAALMVETGSHKRYEKIIVVFCPPELQLARLMSRDKLSLEEAALRISRQMPILEKIKYGDYLVDTSGKFSDTRRQIKQVYRELRIKSEELRLRIDNN